MTTLPKKPRKGNTAILDHPIAAKEEKKVTSPLKFKSDGDRIKYGDAAFSVADFCGHVFGSLWQDEEEAGL